ncbi:hypothetical protein PtB15_8B690 [Puccinia triticina]|nr:hypothetical protein PtB15_8B690 [Puccinia triticina]
MHKGPRNPSGELLRHYDFPRLISPPSICLLKLKRAAGFITKHLYTDRNS